MSIVQLTKNPLFLAGRRMFIARSGLMLSGGAVALLAGSPALAAQLKKTGAKATAGDVSILNSALAAEHQGIAAYQVGAESGLLQKPVLDLALTFQSHHKAHADLLAATVKQLGGTAGVTQAEVRFPGRPAQEPGRCAALRSGTGAGCRIGVPERSPGLRKPRSRQGRRQHPRRRGDALGGAASGAGRSSGPGGIRRLSAAARVEGVLGYTTHLFQHPSAGSCVL